MFPPDAVSPIEGVVQVNSVAPPVLLITAVGKGFTVTAWDVLAEQLWAEVTVTVYVPVLLKVLAAAEGVAPPDQR